MGISTTAFTDVWAQKAFSEEALAKIANGTYPIIFANNGTFQYMEVTEEELEKYSMFDALDEDANAQYAIHGFALIVYDGFDTGGIANKVLENPNDTPTE